MHGKQVGFWGRPEVGHLSGQQTAEEFGGLSNVVHMGWGDESSVPNVGGPNW